MVTEVKAGPVTIRGVSVGGIYTSLHIPELHALFDVGLALRSTAGVRRLFLSHAHVDHAGALPTLLGLRALVGKRRPLRVYLPQEIAAALEQALAILGGLQRYDLSIEPVPMAPGDEVEVEGDLRVRAIRTFHPVPSLGYQLLRRVSKLRPEFRALPGHVIRERRRAGEDLFEVAERLEVAYVTDTLARVLVTEPALFDSKVLILECTFLDERKSLEATHAGCHIHLDELLAHADRFQNQALVLMHFSQIYKPHEIGAILDRRCPPELRRRIVPFAPARGDWPG